ncbi:hypothetical protein [Acidithiobacillus thiooxidans]|uniref:hypothetical protein n=1 Tax=Acidithiobacillus thiooxidans TaxID=930 RepID=UPI001C072623|nr:hypothetical protein [Acidithiobacillus thiooxidans]
MRTLSDMELRNHFVFTKRDMEEKFPNETDKAMGKSLQRMVEDQLLIKSVTNQGRPGDLCLRACADAKRGSGH